MTEQQVSQEPPAAFEEDTYNPAADVEQGTPQEQALRVAQARLDAISEAYEAAKTARAAAFSAYDAADTSPKATKGIELATTRVAALRQQRAQARAAVEASKEALSKAKADEWAAEADELHRHHGASGFVAANEATLTEIRKLAEQSRALRQKAQQLVDALPVEQFAKFNADLHAVSPAAARGGRPLEKANGTNVLRQLKARLPSEVSPSRLEEMARKEADLEFEELGPSLDRAEAFTDPKSWGEMNPERWFAYLQARSRDLHKDPAKLGEMQRRIDRLAGIVRTLHENHRSLPRIVGTERENEEYAVTSLEPNHLLKRVDRHALLFKMKPARLVSLLGAGYPASDLAPELRDRILALDSTNQLESKREAIAKAQEAVRSAGRFKFPPFCFEVTQ